MSYAQRHRSRLELHQGDLNTASTGTHPSSAAHTPLRKGTAVHEAYADHPAPQQSAVSDAALQRSASSLLRASANAARFQQGHAAGIDIAAWSEAASNAVAGERQPFQLLQRTPPKSDPPRLKASRKQFASPHLSAAQSESEPPSTRASLPIVVNVDSPVAAAKAADVSGPQATDLRGAKDQPESTNTAPAAAAAHSSSEPDASAAEPAVPGEMSPSPIPVSHQASLPQSQPPPQQQQLFADSSAPSSARVSTSQWPASETFTARLRNIMETRQQIEALVQKQREDEEEMVHAIASLDEQSQLLPHPPSSPDSATAPHVASPDTVSRQAYDQVLMERNAAFAALRDFKEKGNAIVHRLYDTVKSQQEQSLELVATVEALKRANRRLKESVGANSTGAPAGLVSGTTAELQQKVQTQRRVIEQMDQLMQNADRMLLAMRARVEAAERRASVAAAQSAPLDRSQLPPLPKGGARPAPAGDVSVPVTAAAAATPDAVAAIERLGERYPADQDVAIVTAQQQLLLDRIAQLRESLKQEEAQRLHLEEVYGATSEETARNVALLEERLQRAENPRGVPFTDGNNAAALRRELHTLLDGEENDKTKFAPPNDEEGQGEVHREQESEQTDAQVVPEEDEAAAGVKEAEQPPTPSHASSRASSGSSTPTRTLFTAVSVGDVNSTTAANEITDAAEERKAPGSLAVVSVESPLSAHAKEEVKEEEEEVAAAEKNAETSQLPAEPTAKVASPLSPSPQVAPDDTQPRAYLGRRRRSSGEEKAAAAAAGSAGVGAAAAKPLLGIPVPEASSLGNSLRRSFNSRSSSASRRLVDFRPATAADATSRGLESGTDDEEDEEEGEVKSSGDAAPAAETATIPESARGRAAGLTGITPTVTPTAIHSASSPLPDTSTSAEMSAKRQQRLHQQMEELDKMEADVSDVVRSLDVAEEKK